MRRGTVGTVSIDWCIVLRRVNFNQNNKNIYLINVPGEIIGELCSILGYCELLEEII